jgi:hypothetical protein
MISDVLSDAILEIEEYEEQASLMYKGEMLFIINQAKDVMVAVRNFLDWPSPKKFDEGIGWCIYCGNSDINEKMEPSEAYKEEIGIDALVCSKCWKYESILLDFKKKYKESGTN